MSLTLLALCTCSACALKANINRHFRPVRKHVREPCHATSQPLTAISRPVVNCREYRLMWGGF